jgi:hypothetical protein
VRQASLTIPRDLKRTDASKYEGDAGETLLALIGKRAEQPCGAGLTLANDAMKRKRE